VTPTDSKAIHRGRCLCAGVRYEVTGPLRAITACHCSQCRRTSGHYAAFTAADTAHVHLPQSATLVWYRSSEAAERGFCSVCGSSLFWRQPDSGLICISAGTLDSPTGLMIEKHIFVADKADYYDLHDGLPCHPGE
jgi:hypothetical protein